MKTVHLRSKGKPEDAEHILHNQVMADAVSIYARKHRVEMEGLVYASFEHGDDGKDRDWQRYVVRWPQGLCNPPVIRDCGRVGPALVQTDSGEFYPVQDTKPVADGRCNSCQWWRSTDKTKTLGTCQRFPPVNVHYGPEYAEPNQTEHPLTNSQHWCGEYQLRQQDMEQRTAKPQQTFPLSYEHWYEQNHEELDIACAESGADRELDFDKEAYFEQKYEEYVKEFENVTT